jgi:hypothetical protein
MGVVTLHLRVDRSTIGAGRGVFATRAIARGEVIEACPMLVVDDEQGEALAIGAEGYVFGWGDGATALALGYGSLYNHSFTPNATTLETPDELVVTALDDIAADEEIFINYTGTGTDSGDLWFDDLSL